VLFAVDHHRGSEEHQPGEEYHDAALFDAGAGRMDSFREFRRTLARAGLEDTVVPVVASTTLASRAWRTPLAMVFIDGGHSHAAALADYRCWSPLIVKGGLLAIHTLGPTDPGFDVVVAMLAGGTALVAHGFKSGTRLALNTSPEPVSNILVSSAEDVATVGLLWLVYEYPLAAGAVAAVLLLIVIALLWTAHKIIKRVFFRGPKPQG
jgi:hypothetical protein